MSSDAADRILFPGFRTFDVDAGGVSIHGVTGGSGPPILLLHGFPQTHAIWHRVAPRLAERFTVVATDLTGYGDSAKPNSAAPEHAPYRKGAMARDQLLAMRALGHARFHLVGHDRGGRVAHRLALDHPDAVLTLTVLDIAPTLHMYRHATDAFARAYWHWFFLIKAAPVPETMIGADPSFFLRQHMSRGPAAWISSIRPPSPNTSAASACRARSMRCARITGRPRPSTWRRMRWTSGGSGSAAR